MELDLCVVRTPVRRETARVYDTPTDRLPAHPRLDFVAGVLSVLLAAGVVVPASPVQAANPPDREEARGKVRQALNCLTPIPKHTEDDRQPLEVVIEFEEHQPDVRQGLMLTMEIRNTRTSTVIFVDPMDTTEVFVANAEGMEVQVPGATPAFERCGRGQDRALPHYELNNRPFTVVERSIGRAQHEPRREGKIEDGKVRLLPGENLRYAIRIDQTLADPAEYRDVMRAREKLPPGSLTEPPSVPTTAPITAGEYGVMVLVTVFERAPEEATHSVFKGKLRVLLGDRQKDDNGR
jgi:hypothetical protein